MAFRGAVELHFSKRGFEDRGTVIKGRLLPEARGTLSAFTGRGQKGGLQPNTGRAKS